MSGPHSPGPYRVDGFDILDRDGVKIAYCDTQDDPPTVFANMALFVAAPRLLCALDTLLAETRRRLPPEFHHHPAVTKAIAALLSARNRGA
jgi:hypothetical protein